MTRAFAGWQLDRRSAAQADGDRGPRKRDRQARRPRFSRSASGTRRAADREAAGEQRNAQERRDDKPAAVYARDWSSTHVDPSPGDTHGAHDAGHGIGLGSVGSTQASTRTGSLPRRIAKLVYLPISPCFDTRISSTTPACSERSNRANVSTTVPALLSPLLATTTRLSDLLGQ